MEPKPLQVKLNEVDVIDPVAQANDKVLEAAPDDTLYIPIAILGEFMVAPYVVDTVTLAWPVKIFFTPVFH